jgi:hypothetical protein
MTEKHGERTQEYPLTCKCGMEVDRIDLTRPVATRKHTQSSGSRKVRIDTMSIDIKEWKPYMPTVPALELSNNTDRIRLLLHEIGSLNSKSRIAEAIKGGLLVTWQVLIEWKENRFTRPKTMSFFHVRTDQRIIGHDADEAVKLFRNLYSPLVEKWRTNIGNTRSNAPMSVNQLIAHSEETARPLTRCIRALAMGPDEQKPPHFSTCPKERGRILSTGLASDIIYRTKDPSNYVGNLLPRLHIAGLSYTLHQLNGNKH